MPGLPLTALYAGLLAPLYVLLALRVIAYRRRTRILLGDGNDLALARRMRVQANFAEYVPFALLLMALAEGLEVDDQVIHVLGGVLLLARLSHAWGMSHARELFYFRTVGVAGTFTVILVGALACVWAVLDS